MLEFLHKMVFIENEVALLRVTLREREFFREGNLQLQSSV